MNPKNAAIVSAVQDHLLKATKTQGVLAMHVQDAVASGVIGPDLVVHTLEGDVVASSDCMICKGAKGELWPQKTEKLLAKYTQSNADVIITGEKTQVWNSYIPDPKNFVYAADVTDRDEFTVEASWGTLTGKRGDYVLIDANGESVWIVAKDLFESTYAFTPTSCCGSCGCHG